MERQFYLDLASAGLRMPIATHLVLHEQPEPDAVVRDGARLAHVIESTARRFATPLALPLMDLTLEKEALLLARGVPAAEVAGFHFTSPPVGRAHFQPTPRMVAACQATQAIAHTTPLVPVGMVIGPFSLMTKLVPDPITPVFLAGTGATAEDDVEIAIVERALELAADVVLAYATAQIDAGARAILVCEPAANRVYFSPNQLATSYAHFDRFVMRQLRALRQRLADRDVDLLLHDCGELETGMVTRLGELDPALLSLGSSRQLWLDAALVPKDVVLYGNLPTRQFCSDEVMSVDRARALAVDLTARMHAAGHPFILGSECDILSVRGREATIRAKVEAAFLDHPTPTTAQMHHVETKLGRDEEPL